MRPDAFSRSETHTLRRARPVPAPGRDVEAAVLARIATHPNGHSNHGARPGIAGLAAACSFLAAFFFVAPVAPPARDTPPVAPIERIAAEEITILLLAGDIEAL